MSYDTDFLERANSKSIYLRNTKVKLKAYFVTNILKDIFCLSIQAEILP
jgi:hypothetical protein